jgi:hypothetical protein
MEDTLLPKSFSCSTLSSGEEDGDNGEEITPLPYPDAVSVAVAMPPRKPTCVYTAGYAAMTLTFLVLFACAAMILWYLFDR